MANLPPYSTPRWVKVMGIIALVVVLLLSILHLSGVGGNHGPGRHMPSSSMPLADVLVASSAAHGDAGRDAPSIEHGGDRP